VSGVVVTGIWSMESSITDSEGKFVLDALPDFDVTALENVISLEFDHPDYVQQSIRMSEVESGIVQEDGSWRIKLDPGTLITGVTTDAANGRPLAGMSVRASVSQRMRDESFSRSTQSGPDGKYAIRVPSGSLTLTARASGKENSDFICNEQSYNQTTEGGGEPVTLDFTFSKGKVVSGTIKMSSPGAWRSLSVYLRPAGGGSERYASVARNGSFTFHAVSPGSYQLVVRWRGEGNSEELSVTDVDVTEVADRTGIEIAVESPASSPIPPLNGRVIRADGTPVATALVNLIPVGTTNGGSSPRYTAADGTFTFTSLDESISLDCWVCDCSRDFAGWAHIESNSDRSTPLTITLAPTVEISGKVTLNGEPARRRALFLSQRMNASSSRNVLSTRTNEKGEYRMRGFLIPDRADALRLCPSSPRGWMGNGHELPTETPTEPLKGYNFILSYERELLKVGTEREGE
jgi:hypothetical protein